MAIKDWPEQDRPREKLMARGAAALTDAELLALLMVTGRRGMDVLQNARLLLSEHGPLRKLLDMPPEEMQKLPGLGIALACKLQAAMELAHRHLRAALDKGESLNPHAARHYFHQRLRGRPREVFAALFLDNRNRTLAFEELFSGTIDASGVYPREVARHALLHNAAAVIVKGYAAPKAFQETYRSDFYGYICTSRRARVTFETVTREIALRSVRREHLFF